MHNLSNNNIQSNSCLNFQAIDDNIVKMRWKKSNNFLLRIPIKTDS